NFLLQMLIALTRGVSLRIAECELTFIEWQCIDYPRASQQHSRYRQLLRNLGATVVELPSGDQCPDCCFLEDTALVLDEVAVITRPGSETRRREVDGVAPTIMKYRNVGRLQEVMMRPRICGRGNLMSHARPSIRSAKIPYQFGSSS